jgi:hypothetical protein
MQGVETKNGYYIPACMQGYGSFDQIQNPLASSGRERGKIAWH